MDFMSAFLNRTGTVNIHWISDAIVATPNDIVAMAAAAEK
jgi:hypothetical protein